MTTSPADASTDPRLLLTGLDPADDRLAALHARFAEADLPSILDHHATTTAAGPTHRAAEDRSLTQGTSGWAALGGPGTDQQPDQQPGEQTGMAS